MTDSTTNPIADAGHLTMPLTAAFDYDPVKGGELNFTPDMLTKILGCDPKHVGNCGAALTLKSIDFHGANLPCDSTLIISTMKGSPCSSACAVSVDKYNTVTASHGNIRKGNVRSGLGISVPLQPSEYLKDGTQSEQMVRALATVKNWKDHMGCTTEEVLTKSAHTIKSAKDTHGNEHTRMILNDNGGPLDKLVNLNKNSPHPIMSMYSEKNLKRVDGKIVMDHKHAEALAETLAETLAPCTPISAEGLRIAIVPHEGSVGTLTKTTTGQLDIRFQRHTVKDIIDGKASPMAIRTTELGVKQGDAKKPENVNVDIWNVPIGKQGAITVEGKTKDVDVYSLSADGGGAKGPQIKSA